MLKGHVFSKQIFGNPIFALFINTFLDGKNGVSNNYKNGMKVTYSGTNLTINSGAVCIQGRFLEEDTSTTISSGTDNSYCKLVIEIDLDKENTESDFTQGTYKIVKSSSGYPNLTQSNIVKNVSGIYQYELARFRTNSSGISNFQDMRTFLDFDTIYDAIEAEYQSVLDELEQELQNVVDGSGYWLKATQLTNQDLNNYNTEGFYYAAGGNTVTNKPSGVDHFGVMVKRIATGLYKQILDNNEERWTRYYGGGTWSNWIKDINKNDFAVITGNIAGDGTESPSKTINYPTGFNRDNCVVSTVNLKRSSVDFKGYGAIFDSSSYLTGAIPAKVALGETNITLEIRNINITQNGSIMVPSIPTSINFTYTIVLMKIS